MSYAYQPASRASRLPTDEGQSSTTPSTAVEHRFHATDSADDDDSASIASSVEDAEPAPRVPMGLMIALTCAIGGLQLIWAAIFSHGSPYLLSLGITKSQSSLIWAIAPVCGTFVQPVVGSMSDNSRSRFGRRRPYIVAGTIGIVLSLIALAWISDIVSAFTSLFGIQSSRGVKWATQLGTILCVLFLNISIQPMQSGLRALIVDYCPSEQQRVASAWAGRFTSGNNIFGYILGSLPVSFIHDNESWRFRFLTLTSVVILTITVLITIYFISEENTLQSTHAPQNRNAILRTLRSVRDGWSLMPTQSRHVCLVQFFAWMGWFGFLFYSTSYISRLYVAESHRNGIKQLDNLQDAGVRLGTFASLLSSIAALITTIIAPYVAVRSTMSPNRKVIPKTRATWWRQTHIIWSLSHLLYTLCTLSTFFVRSTNIEIFLITITGISWGITQWAPFTLLGEDIAMHQAERDSTADEEGHRSTSSQSGAMMGVHNAAISVPQIVAALGSSVIFWIFEEGKEGEDDGIAWVLRCSGLAALVAAYFAWRLK